MLLLINSLKDSEKASNEKTLKEYSIKKYVVTPMFPLAQILWFILRLGSVSSTINNTSANIKAILKMDKQNA